MPIEMPNITTREKRGIVSWANPPQMCPPYGPFLGSCPASFDVPLPCPHICLPSHCHLASLTCLFSVLRPWRGGRGARARGVLFCVSSRTVSSPISERGLHCTQVLGPDQVLLGRVLRAPLTMLLPCPVLTLPVPAMAMPCGCWDYLPILGLHHGCMPVGDSVLSGRCCLLGN